MDKQRKTGSRKSGFTLVEIALALLIVSVGLLSVFSLFPAGMTSNRKAIDETHAAFFADDVLNGLKAQVAAGLEEWDDIDRIRIPFQEAQWVLADDERNTVQYESPVEGDEDGGVRIEYRLRVGYRGPDRASAYARLEVWPGRLWADEDPIRFYTEFFNTRP